MRPIAPPSSVAGDPEERDCALPEEPIGAAMDGYRTGEYPRAEAPGAAIPIHEPDFVRRFVEQSASRLLGRSTALCRLLGIDDFAHDAVRQTVLRLLVRGSGIADDGPGTAERYALVVLRRICVDERRRRALEESAANLALAGSIEPDASIDRLRADLLLDLGPTADPRRLLRAALCCFEYLPAHIDSKQAAEAGSLRAYWLTCVEGRGDEEASPLSSPPESSRVTAARGKQLLAGWIHALCGAGARVGNDGGRYQSAWQIGFEAAQSFLLEHPDWWTLGTKRLVAARAAADQRLLVASVPEQTEALLALVDQHEHGAEREATRLVLEVDGQWTAELSGHTEAVRVRLGARARSVTLRDEKGELRAFFMIDELEVAGEAAAARRVFDQCRVGLVLSRRPAGLELEVLTGARAVARAHARATAGAEGGARTVGADGADEPAEPETILPPSGRADAVVLGPGGRATEASSAGQPPLDSPPMLEDELGGQVSAVRFADEEPARDGRVAAPTTTQRPRRVLPRATGRLGRLVTAAIVVVTATVGLLYYQQLRFERQQALAEAERSRLELERARLEREKVLTELRIRELQSDLRLAKDEAERVRLEAEIEREEASVEGARGSGAPAPTGSGARAPACSPGEPSCTEAP